MVPRRSPAQRSRFAWYPPCGGAHVGLAARLGRQSRPMDAMGRRCNLPTVGGAVFRLAFWSDWGRLGLCAVYVCSVYTNYCLCWTTVGDRSNRRGQGSRPSPDCDAWCGGPWFRSACYGSCRYSRNG
jgi:hypothetical protein